MADELPTRTCGKDGCDGVMFRHNEANSRYAGRGQDLDSTDRATKPKGAPDEYGWKCSNCGHFVAD